MKNQEKSFRKIFFSTREIAGTVGLTIYQTRGYLEALQSSRVVEKANSERGRSVTWRLL
nr:FaeA/PapI family transcriptional regulator [Escherichia coli]